MVVPSTYDKTRLQLFLVVVEIEENKMEVPCQFVTSWIRIFFDRFVPFWSMVRSFNEFSVGSIGSCRESLIGVGLLGPRGLVHGYSSSGWCGLAVGFARFLGCVEVERWREEKQEKEQKYGTRSRKMGGLRDDAINR